MCTNKFPHISSMKSQTTLDSFIRKLTFIWSMQLVQLLLKASQDKRFVCEAAEKALIAMTTWISPISLLPKLQPYLKNKNPRIRAKASMCFSRSVSRLVWVHLWFLPILMTIKTCSYWLLLSWSDFLLSKIKINVNKNFRKQINDAA